MTKRYIRPELVNAHEAEFQRELADHMQAFTFLENEVKRYRAHGIARAHVPRPSYASQSVLVDIKPLSVDGLTPPRYAGLTGFGRGEGYGEVTVTVSSGENVVQQGCDVELDPNRVLEGFYVNFILQRIRLGQGIPPRDAVDLKPLYSPE